MKLKNHAQPNYNLKIIPRVYTPNEATTSEPLYEVFKCSKVRPGTQRTKKKNCGLK